MVEPAGAPIELMLMVRSFLGGLNEAMPPPVIRQFAAVTRQLFFRRGTVIYREGEPAAHIYFVVEGEVALETPGEQRWTFGPYAAFGILDALLERPHSRTARARTDVRALVVSSEDWLSLAEDNFELTRLALARNATGLWELALAAPEQAFTAPREIAAGSAAAALAPLERRAALNSFERLLILRLSPPLERARMQPLIRLAAASGVSSIEEGELIFQEGDAMTALYFVASGAVRVERSSPELNGVFGPTDLVGGYGSLGLERYPFSARALGDSVLIELSLDDLFDVMEDHFDLVRSIQSYLAAERDRLQRLRAPTT